MTKTTRLDKHVYTNEQMAQAAAGFCYRPSDDPVIVWMIEALVLPDDVGGYTEEEMAGYILARLEERGL